MARPLLAIAVLLAFSGCGARSSLPGPTPDSTSTQTLDISTRHQADGGAWPGFDSAAGPPDSHLADAPPPRWHEVPLPAMSPVDGSFRAVWGSGPSNVFVVGTGGRVYRYNGTALYLLSDRSPMDLFDVWGVSAKNVFILADKALLRFGGAYWETIAIPPHHCVRLWGSGPKNLYAVGGQQGHGEILHYDGSGWTVAYTGPQALRDISGTGPDNILAVGRDGMVLHFDGASWTKQKSGTMSTLTGIWALEHDSAFAVGIFGTIVHLDGGEWKPMYNSWTLSNNAVWGSGSDDLYSVGNVGLVLHFDGIAWNQVSVGSGSMLLDVWGSGPNQVFVVGQNSTLLRYGS